jgi:hypothetical protein
MKILLASTPATGHLNPLLATGHILIAEGHEVVGLSGNAFRKRIEGIGAGFRPLPEGADFDLGDIISVVPELKDIPPGPRWRRTAIERIFVDTIPAQHRGLRQALRDFPADIIIGDDMFFGLLPMLLGARETAFRRSLRHIDLALAPRGQSPALCRLATRNHPGTDRGIRGYLPRA